jgi:hypothetical protein
LELIKWKRNSNIKSAKSRTAAACGPLGIIQLNMDEFKIYVPLVPLYKGQEDLETYISNSVESILKFNLKLKIELDSIGIVEPKIFFENNYKLVTHDYHFIEDAIVFSIQTPNIKSVINRTTNISKKNIVENENEPPRRRAAGYLRKLFFIRRKRRGI